MTGRGDEEAKAGRMAEAADWFARMRAPDAERSRSAFELWRADSRNAQAYAEIEHIWSLSGQLAPQHAADPRSRHRKWSGGARLALAAVLAALALGGLSLLTGLAGPATNLSPHAVTYASRVGEIRAVTLADGSKVWLDTATRLAVDLSGDERHVRLFTGRARFEVAPDPARPFVVIAGDGTVTARGTVFDVRLADGAVEVMLLEGKVDVEALAPDPDRLARRVRLEPGQQARLGEGDSAPAIVAVRPGRETWVAGRLEMNATPLDEVIREANRYSERRILLGDPALGRLRVTGALRLGDAEAVAARLSAAFDLHMSHQPGGDVLLSAPAP